jgi:FkbM family methyltransferase
MLRPTQRVRRSRIFGSLARLSRNYLRWFGNASLRPEKNGEHWLLGALREAGVRVVLDVGANVGSWATAAAAAFPDATIYALEVVPATFETLRARTGREPRIRAFGTGLADRAGTLTIRYDPRYPTHATASDYPPAAPGDQEQRVDCPVTTGDEFLRTQGIARVDFLKIDVEGAEPLVLRGFADTLRDRRVRFVQFEYGRFHVLAGFRLKEFHDLFRGYGYAVGKIFPDYVDLRDYDVGDEDFFVGGNYLACPLDDPWRMRLALGA